MRMGSNGVLVQANYSQPWSLFEPRPSRDPLLPPNQQYPVNIHSNLAKAHTLLKNINATGSSKPLKKNPPAPGPQPMDVNSPIRIRTSAMEPYFLKVSIIDRRSRNSPNSAFWAALLISLMHLWNKSSNCSRRLSLFWKMYLKIVRCTIFWTSFQSISIQCLFYWFPKSFKKKTPKKRPRFRISFLKMKIIKTSLITKLNQTGIRLNCTQNKSDFIKYI